MNLQIKWHIQFSTNNIENFLSHIFRFLTFSNLICTKKIGFCIPRIKALWSNHRSSAVKCNLGMAIPRRISFLEESRSQGMTNLHSSGIEEYEIYSSGSSGNFEEWVIPKNLKNSPKIKKNVKKKIKKKKFQHWIYTS